MVPQEGLEPPHPCEYQILSLARLPVPPLGPTRGLARRFARRQATRANSKPDGHVRAACRGRKGLSVPATYALAVPAALGRPERRFAIELFRLLVGVNQLPGLQVVRR